MMCATYGNNGMTFESKPPHISTGSALSLEEQLRISSSQFDQVERENARVVTQLKEVIKMNAHWQRYDAQREEYVQKLTRTNQQLQDKNDDLQKIVDEFLDNNGRNSDNDHLSDHGYASPPLSPSPRQLSTSPPHSPEPSSSNKDHKIAALTDHISKLKDRILVLENGRSSRRKADDDELSMLREQINVCVEDFKQERKDRERFHSENQRLRERLAQTEQIVMKNEEQMSMYQEQIKRLQEKCQLRPTPRLVPRDGFDVPCCYPEDRPQMQKMSPNINRKTFRHPVYFGDDLTDLPSDVEIDGLPCEPEDEPDGPVPANNGVEALVPDVEGAHLTRTVGDKKDDGGRIAGDGGDVVNDDDGDEPLQCPRCLASFSIDKHADLLDHINVCME